MCSCALVISQCSNHIAQSTQGLVDLLALLQPLAYIKQCLMFAARAVFCVNVTLLHMSCYILNSMLQLAFSGQAQKQFQNSTHLLEIRPFS